MVNFISLRKVILYEVICGFDLRQTTVKNLNAHRNRIDTSRKEEIAVHWVTESGEKSIAPIAKICLYVIEARLNTKLTNG